MRTIRGSWLAPRHTALGLFALLAGIYLLTAGGHTYSIDGELMFGVTESLVQRGTFALNTNAFASDPTYNDYGPGNSLAAVPLYLLGQAIATFFPPNATPWLTRALACCLNAFVTAGLGALVYLAVYRLGYSQRIALGLALLYGLGTLAWHYSKTFFAEPLTALLLFAAFTLTLWAVRSPAFAQPTTPPRLWGTLLLAGLLAGISPAAKIHAGLAAPFVVLYFVIHVGLAYRAQAQAGAGRAALRAALLRLLAWGGGALLTLCVFFAFQWALYGHPLNSGYGDTGNILQQMAAQDPLTGVVDLLVGSNRGILWYVPTLLLWPLALWYCARQHWPLALLCLLLALSHVYFYAHWFLWGGGGAWGPRFLNIVLPFLLLPLAAYLERLRGWRTPLRSGALLLLLLASVPVQLSSVAINLTTYASLPNERRDFLVPDSGIVVHLTLAARQAQQLYRVHAAPERVALVRGFAYSEGSRSAAEQVPRWTLPQATIAVRPPAAETLRLRLALQGCRPQEAADVPPAAVTLRAGDTTLIDATPCPARTYHLLLPPTATHLHLNATPWDPLAAGIKREDGPLGVWLADLEVSADDEPLPVVGQLVPVAPLPPGAGPVTIREWVSDYRYGHWDFWWWYLWHSGFPAGPSALLAAGWLALALALLTAGGWQVRRAWLTGREPAHPGCVDI